MFDFPSHAWFCACHQLVSTPACLCQAGNAAVWWEDGTVLATSPGLALPVLVGWQTLAILQCMANWQT